MFTKVDPGIAYFINRSKPVSMLPLLPLNCFCLNDENGNIRQRVDICSHYLAVLGAHYTSEENKRFTFRIARLVLSKNILGSILFLSSRMKKN